MTALDYCNAQNEFVMNAIRMECQIKQLEKELESLRVSMPALGSYAHTFWHEKFCETNDTLLAVQNCLCLARRAQKKGAK